MKPTKKVLQIALLALITMSISCSSDDDNAPITPPQTVVTTVTASDFNTTIDENIGNGTSLGKIAGSSNTGAVRFSFVSQTPSGTLALNEATGELTVADESVFNFEENDTIRAEVKVSREEVSKTSKITIVINNVYDLYEDREALIKIFNANPDSYLSWDITKIDMSDWNGVTIQGDRVVSLNVQNMNLTTMPGEAMHSLTALTRLGAFGNQLTSIDVSKNILLEQLLLENNDLTELDLSTLAVLTDFKAHSNKLTKLNIANGNNSNMWRMNVEGNLDLECVTVDEGATDGYDGWSTRSDNGSAIYSTDCASQQPR